MIMSPIFDTVYLRAFGVLIPISACKLSISTWNAASETLPFPRMSASAFMTAIAIADIVAELERTVRVPPRVERVDLEAMAPANDAQAKAGTV